MLIARGLGRASSTPTTSYGREPDARCRTRLPSAQGACANARPGPAKPIDPRVVPQLEELHGSAVLARLAVPLGDPGREASARRAEPCGELRVERSDLLPKLEEVKVEQSLGVAHVGTGAGAIDRGPALGAGHVARLGERAKHGPYETRVTIIR
jgi:hypothetical protein